MSAKTQSTIRTTYHRDGTVTVWDVYSQSYLRTGDPSDRLLASLDTHERERVIRHTGRAAEICGRAIRVDESGGQGHSWRLVPEGDLPADIAEEIAAEILDGRDTCRDYHATNGCHYRW